MDSLQKIIDEIGLNEYINAVLVQNDGRPAFMIQPSDYNEKKKTDKITLKKLENIKKYFPEPETDIFIKKTTEEAKIKFPKIADHYLQEINFLSSNFHLTDKLPFNFIFFGFIRAVFPNAKIISLIKFRYLSVIVDKFVRFILKVS